MLIFLYGEDQWRKKQKLDQITARFIKEVDPSRMNLVVLNAGSADEVALRTALRTSPFLARKRMLVLVNFLFQGRKGQQEVLRQALPRCGEEQIVVISEDLEKPKTWKNQEVKGLWEDLEKNAKIEAFKPLWGTQLEAAIVAQAKNCGLALQKDAAASLAIMSGGDLTYAAQELDKLVYYCNGRTATLEDIRQLSTSAGGVSIFEFLDALGEKSLKTLLRTAQEQLQDEEPLMLVARAMSHLRALLAMKVAGADGARVLKLHPFQAKKSSAQLRHWDVPALKKFLFQLLLLDYSTKRGLAADPATQLTALLTKVSTQ